MRPRLIRSVPGLDPNGTPFGRFKQFAGMIAAVPKSEVENVIKKSGSAKNGAGLKKRKVSNANKNANSQT
jgi:hypothetical protein